MRLLRSIPLLAVWSLVSLTNAKIDRNHQREFALQAARSPAGRPLSFANIQTEAKSEDPDYTCSKDKKCDLGCCGAM
jgi:hypothetical protein